MNIYCENNNIVLTEVSDFNPVHIFECGQAFRWDRNSDGSYTGIAFGKALRIFAEDDKITLYNTTRSDFDNIWHNYFDFDRDYTAVKNILCENDDVMKTAVPYGEGIRILKQELFETVISFIISASNNIPRIKKIIDLLCTNFGQKIEYEGKYFYTFPDCNTLAECSVEDLALIRAGFRDKYIIDAAKKFSEGKISYEMLCNYDTQDIKNILKTISGVGDKVANCILLFGLARTDSFPVDVWVKRIMEILYLKKDAKNNEIEKFAFDKFGNICGLAQQYLFFYARENL